MANKLKLTRDQLASFLKDAEQIKQFEQLFALADSIAPDVVNEININAASAQASANDALAQLQRLADVVGLLATEPAQEHDNFVVADYIDTNTLAPTPNGKPGRAYWDDGAGSLVVGLKGGNVTYIDGQQEYALCYNDSGGALTKGQVVYISGAQGNRVAIKLAQADSDANSAHTIGFVAESIAAGAEGWVHSAGPIYKLNTFGYTAGDTVYLSPTTPGAWTTTRPSAPNHTVIVGFIERVSATVGSIYVKVDNGYELDELHNVKITSVANNDLLQYDSTGPYWKNVAPSSITIGTATNLFGGAAGSVPYQTAASTTTFLSIGTAAQVLQVNSGATAPEWVSSTGTGNVVRATSPTIATPTITTSATVPLVIGGTGTTSTLRLRSTSGVGTTGADIIFQTGNNGATEAMRIINSGNVSIGSSSNFGKLYVATSANAGFEFYPNNSAGINLILNYDRTGGVYQNLQTRAATHQWLIGTTEAARIDSSSNMLVTGAGGLGYGTGSGGAVTQATSRTTGVTLDKTNGAITLVSAAGTTTWQSFTVTNNKVAATDTVIVNQKSGTDLYMIHVTAVAAGSFRITFATTGGTTTEQPVFNFAIIKAVTS